MNQHTVLSRLSSILFLILLFFASFTSSSFAADSVCARVKIEVRQELTFERQAFDAHMAINNGLTTIALQNVKIDVTFADKDGNAVIASTDPNSTNALFFIRVDSMGNISNVEGTGTVNPSTTADIHWLIIPAPGASNGLIQGALYYVGATLRYTIGGIEHITSVSPDYIFVKPMPQLTLDYFLPQDVYADDPFTAETEPSVPFVLGVRAKNTGYGTAKALKIDSAQPKIIDNVQGLLIGFNIDSTEVNGTLTPNTLLADFGDVPAQASRMARWMMTTTLSGRFTSFTADFSHADELGGRLTSLLDATNTHVLVHDVLVDLPGRDTIRDFLAHDATYKVYESEGVDTEVVEHIAPSPLTATGPDTYALTIPATSGFAYTRRPDPFSGTKLIKEVIRSDGKRIKPDNAWLSKTRVGSNSWEYFINLFDAATTGSYTVIFIDPHGTNHPPVLGSIPDVTSVEGQPLSFIVQATDPDGAVPSLTAAPLPALAQFADQGTGEASFTWTPSKGQAGRYEITVTASDGSLSASKRLVLTITPANTAPLMPSSPSPANDAANVSVKASLSWSGGDPDGQTVTYDVYLGSNLVSSQSATLYAPSLAFDTTYSWKIVAKDSQGLETQGPTWQFTTFRATDDADNDGLTNAREIELGKDPFTPDNDPPAAHAGADQTAITGQTVALSGSGSDPEEASLTYLWTLTEKPAESQSVLSDPTNPRATFTPDKLGTYILKLVVNDGHQDSSPSTVTITVTNGAPVANAGPDKNVITNQPTTLDASASSDPDGTTITYAWVFLETPPGSQAVLSDPTSPKPEFTPDIEGAYRLELTVSDGELSSTDEVAITAQTPNVAPNADAGVDQNVNTLSLVQIDASKSQDPDNKPQPLTYLWSFVSIPEGSSLTDAAIFNNAAPDASFTPDIDGAYVLKISVFDGELSSEDTVQITAATPNVAPNANAGEDKTIYLKQTATVDGSLSNDPDNGPQPLTYQWAFVSLPSGSTLTNDQITDATKVSALFIPDKPGTYVVSLTVNDGDATASDNVAVTVKVAQVSGSGSTGTAQFALEITGSSGWLEYYFASMPLTFIGNATDLTVSDTAATIAGSGTVNGQAGYTFTAEATAGTFGLAILNPNGSTFYSSGLIAGGIIIQGLDAFTPQITLSTQTAKDSYKTTEQVTINGILTNVTDSPLVLSVTTTVRDKTGAEVFQQITSASVAPHDSTTITETWQGTTQGPHTITQSTENARSYKVITLTKPASFSLRLDQSALGTAQGTTNTLTVHVDTTDFTNQVTLALEGLPSGVTSAPVTVTPPTGATLCVITDAATTPGTYEILVKGEGTQDEAATQSLPLTLAITAFALEAVPPSLEVQQQSTAAFTIRALSQNGYTGTLTLTDETTPIPGGIVTLTTNTLTVPSEMTIRLETSAATTPGAYTLIVSATDGAVTKKLNLPMTITQNPDLIPGIVATPGPSPTNEALVTLFTRDFVPILEFKAFDSKFGAHATMGDIDGDGEDEIIVAPGPDPSANATVKVYKKNGTFLLEQTIFSTKFGLTVAAGDIDGDGRAEIIVGAGPGPLNNSHVKVLSFNGSSLVTTGIDFVALPSLYLSGANVALGDLDGDGIKELIVGAGPGLLTPSRVRAFKLNTASMGNWTVASTLSDFTIEFIEGLTCCFGARVAAGDINGDGKAEIIVGAGPGPLKRPTVKIFNGNGTFTGTSFDAYPDDYRLGVNIASKDLNGDGVDEIITAPGPWLTYKSWVRVFRGDGTLLSNGFFAYPDSVPFGARVSGGNVGQ